MSHWSQDYPVKSNAARAAAKHGLSRADLVQNEDTNAWRFMIPDGQTLGEKLIAAASGADTAPQARTEPSELPATEVAATAPEATTEPAPEAVTVPKGWDVIEGGPELTNEESNKAILDHMQATVPLSAGDQPAVRSAAAKVARRTKKPGKDKPAAKVAKKAAKVAKAPRAGKVKREGHGKFSGSPAFQGRRASQGRRGVMDDVMKQLKARWTPADEILTMTGWVSNTFRGVLGKFRRDGMTVKMDKRDGKTCYRIAA